MPSIERSLTIDAPPAKVYEAFADFGRWLEWNPHLREVTPLCEGPLATGCTARIALKLSPLPSMWEVTEVDPGRSFAWASSSIPGIRLVFDHIAESADGGTRATFRIDIEGPFAFLGGLTGAFYLRNLDRSLAALKRMLEAESTPPPDQRQPAAEKPEAEAPPKGKAKAKAKSKGKGKAKAKAETEAGAVTQAQAPPEAQVQAEVQAEPEAQAPPEAEVHPEPEAQAPPKAEVQAEPGAQAPPEAEPEAEAPPEAEPEAEAPPEAEVQTETEDEAPARS